MSMSMPTNPITRRLALPGWSVLRFSLTIIAGALLAAAIATGVLVVFWIGIPVAVVVLLAIRVWANSQRRVIGEQLGVHIPVPYRPRLKKARLDQQALWLVREAATWRDVAWLAIDATLGFMVNLLYLCVFGIAVYYLVQPLLLVTIFHSGPTPAVNDFGFFDFDTPVKTLMLVPLALACGVAWWRWGELFLRWYSHLGVLLLGPTSKALLTARVSELRHSRDQTVDHAAAELRRIERDLHDGAQARLVSLGMTIGLAEEMVERDPATARRLLAEAREASGTALVELRHLVRGIHPPVLAERGLDGAIRALAHSLPVPTAVDAELSGRPDTPVESAAYFAVAEALANVSRHSGARTAWVTMRHADGLLSMTVGDDGAGGADPVAGTGLRGIERRLAAFDGTMALSSPPGGPTVVTMELPCALSSPKTTLSSGTD